MAGGTVETHTIAEVEGLLARPGTTCGDEAVAPLTDVLHRHPGQAPRLVVSGAIRPTRGSESGA